VWKKGWTELRDIQDRAVEKILRDPGDLIVAAATAGGKTEAAFLPILSRLVEERNEEGIRAVYIGPLKALINDQFRRLDELCEELDIPVHRWHGDVASSKKKALVKNPSGILLITPESLEALLVIHGRKIPELFRNLGHVVIDEMHIFMGTERGKQLQSLLHRLDTALARKPHRIGLSATLGDMDSAAEFLRPREGNEVTLVVSTESKQELKLQIRTGGEKEIGDHLFKNLRGSDNLVFANRRSDVELYADLLRGKCEAANVPNEFWPHHGSLSRELRTEVEAQLKSRTRPVSVVCTNTLELGIDVGHVQSVAQVGAPPSVAALRQRLGRSGRRPGEPSILRIYVNESDGLHIELVKSIAMVNLLARKWYEPPDQERLHFSTLVQQVLSLIMQHEGIKPLAAWEILCRTGPFTGIDKTRFADFLRCLGRDRLVETSPDGLLLLGEAGEKTVDHYTFYTAFTTEEEYQLKSQGKSLGSLPVSRPLIQDMHVIFAGRRWQVASVDEGKRTVEVIPAPGGKPPSFGSGTAALVHDEVRKEMLAVYRSEEVPPFLDGPSKKNLEEARRYFHELALDRNHLVGHEKDTLLFCWYGDRILNTLAILIRNRGLKVNLEEMIISVDRITPDDLQEHLDALLEKNFPSAPFLAGKVPNKRLEKYDRVLSGDLMNIEYGLRNLDVKNARTALEEMIR
jgi:ATP-dependent Lhr-like helicase